MEGRDPVPSSYVSRAHSLPVGSASQPACSAGAPASLVPPPQLSVAPRSSRRTQLSGGAGGVVGRRAALLRPHGAAEEDGRPVVVVEPKGDLPAPARCE